MSKSLFVLTDLRDDDFRMYFASKESAIEQAKFRECQVYKFAEASVYTEYMGPDHMFVQSSDRVRGQEQWHFIARHTIWE